MPVLPDRALLRAVAEIIIAEEKQRERRPCANGGADHEIAAELARLRERIDEYGNVIRQPGPPGERGLPGAARAQPGDGERGEPGPPGERGQRWRARAARRARRSRATR